MVARILSLVLLVPALMYAGAEEETFEFKGTHFTAEYFGCDLACIADTDTLICVMNEAVKESGATILNTIYHIFPNGSGLTMLTMLAESHASIHTYPEHRSCFIDLFTCGNRCSHEKFDAILREYLKPGKVYSSVTIRPYPFVEEDLLDQDSSL